MIFSTKQPKSKTFRDIFFPPTNIDAHRGEKDGSESETSEQPFETAGNQWALNIQTYNSLYKSAIFFVLAVSGSNRRSDDPSKKLEISKYISFS